MPKAFALEFRRDVVAVARKGAPLSQIAGDFGIFESCLHRWLKLADVDDGVGPGVTSRESAELRELKKRNRTLGQENVISSRRSGVYDVTDKGYLSGMRRVVDTLSQAVSTTQLKRCHPRDLR